MLEAYSLNVEVSANTAIPFNNVTIKKGCNMSVSGSSSFQLNKCGVYKVHVDGVAGAASTIQLKKNEVLQPQAQSTGTTLGFETLVQVPTNNSCCPCSSPVTIQIVNAGEATATLTNVNIVIEKVA